MSEANYDLVDLHKNVVDEIVLVSSSGKSMKRETDLIDVWFDSGAMPYAQWHYPFENKDKIDENKDFQPTLLPKVSTRHAAGSIRCTLSEHWFLIK